MLPIRIRPLLISLESKSGCYYRRCRLFHHYYHTTSTAPSNNNNNNDIVSTTETAIFYYAENLNTRYLKVRGPDTIPFLNGLCTSKLQPQTTKKNLTTISPNTNHSYYHNYETLDSKTVNESIINTLNKLDIKNGNWGIFKERGLNGTPFISRFGTYTAFLNSTGKLITDTIIYPTPVASFPSLPQDDSCSFFKVFKYPEFLVGLDSEIFERMVKYFRAHILLQRVKVEEVSPSIRTWDVMLGFKSCSSDGNVENQNQNQNGVNPWLENLLFPESSMSSPSEALEFANGVISGMFSQHEDKILGMYFDTRCVGLLSRDPFAPLSLRIVTDASVDDITKVFNSEVFPVPLEFKRVDDKFFRRSRLVNGLVDGTRDIKPESVLPLELNFDYYPNVVSVDKGCYVGQELLTRSLSTGILRKRVVPVRISNYGLLSEYIEKGPLEVQMLDQREDSSNSNSKNYENPYNPFSKGISNKQTTRRRNRPVGTLLCAEDDIGLMRLRTEHFPRAFEDDPELRGLFYIDLKLDLEDKDKRVELTPIRPFWLNEWLSEHQSRAKQGLDV